jgi:multiple sugar transport system substrate-binding protein
MKPLLLIVAFLLVLTPFSAAQDTVTLQVWDFGGVEFEYIDSIIIPAFEAQFPHIRIEHLGIPESDYNLKLETAIASRETPDVALMSYSYRLWQAGHVVPLDDFMARDGFAVEDFYPIFQSWDMLNGSVYSFPINMHLWGMIVNLDLFEAAGVTPPSLEESITFDQWLEYARALNVPTENFEDRIWGSVNFTPNWNSMNNYMSDPYVLGADGRDCLTNSQTEDWIHAWEVMLTAYNEGLTPESTPALLGDFTGDLFLQGKLGMTYGSEGNAIAAMNQGLNVAFVGQPVVTPGWPGNVGAWDTSYGIMAQSQHPEEAWTFLKWLATDGAMLIANSADLGNLESTSSPPTYRPLAEEWAGDDPFRLQVLALHEHVQPPPFSPDIWTSVDPFYEAWRRMTEEGESVTSALAFAAEECQFITDDLWDTWEFLGS